MTRIWVGRIAAAAVAASVLVSPLPAVAAAPTADPVLTTTDQHGTVAYLPVVPRSSQTTTSGVETVTTLGVSIGDVFIPSTATSTVPQAGYQVVVVSASWAASTDGAGEAQLTGGPAGDGIISNTTYTVAGSGDVTAMFDAINTADYSSCSPNGCYLIVASLYNGIGYVGCAGQAVLQGDNGGCDQSTAQPGAGFAALGGSYESSFADPTSSYSLVTPVSRNTTPTDSGFAGPGNGYETMSCIVAGISGGTACTDRPRGDAAGALNGSVTGAFVGADQSDPVVFTPTGHAAIQGRSITPQGGGSYNTVTVSVGDQVGNVVSDVVPAADAAFQVVQIDRTSMEVIGNATFVMNGPDPANRSGMLTALQNPTNGSNENTIWVIASIGTIVADASPDYVAVAQAMANVGASFTTVNRLGITPPAAVANGQTCPAATLGDYAYIGWAPPTIPGAALSETPVIESSGVVQCVSRGAAAAATTTVAAGAVMVQNQRGLYSGQSWSSIPGVAGVQSAVLRDSDAGWPATVGGSTTPTPGQAAAYAVLSGIAVPSSTDVRTEYGGMVRNTSVTTASTALGNVNLATDPQSGGYTTADFADVQAELLAELEAVSAISTYDTNVTNILNGVQVDSNSKITAAYTAVSNALQHTSADDPAIADVVGGVGSIADDLAQFLPGIGSEIGSAIGAISEIAALGIEFQGTSGTYQSSIAGLETTWGDLENNLPQIYTQQTNALNVTVSLAAVDPIRLQRLATAVSDLNNAINTDVFTTNDIVNGYVQNATKTYYTAYLNQNYFVYSKIALASAVDFADATPLSEPYPFTVNQPNVELSLHAIVCFEDGTCGAENAQTNNYFVYLAAANPAATTSNGAGTMYWGVYFLAAGDGGCGIRCRVTFPEDAVFNDLFGIPQAGQTTPLGVYPGDFYNRFGGLAQASYDQWCSVSFSHDEENCPNGSGDTPCVGICDTPSPSPTVPPGDDPSGKGSGNAAGRDAAGSLPVTGLEFPWFAVPVGGGLIAVGALFLVLMRYRTRHARGRG